MNPEHVLLLRTAHGASPEETRAAWAEWRALGGTLDGLDHAGLRLTRLLYVPLAEAGIDDPDLPRLKGVLRHSWSRAETAKARLAEIIRVLDGHGIESMVLKGAAMAALHYANPGQRFMWDVDVLVRPRDRDAALAALTADGWLPERGEATPHRRLVRHAASLEKPGGLRLDLHWSAQHEPADDESLWTHSVPLDLRGTTTRAPSPADLLVLACAHAQRFQVDAPAHLAADALVLIGHGVDWDRVVERAREANLTLPVRDALTAWRDDLGAAVPAGVLDALARHPVPARTRLAYEQGLKPWHTARKLPVYYDRWRRLGALADPDRPRPPLIDWVAAGCDQPSRRAFVVWVARWPQRADLPWRAWRSASTSTASSPSSSRTGTPARS